MDLKQETVITKNKALLFIYVCQHHSYDGEKFKVKSTKVKHSIRRLSKEGTERITCSTTEDNIKACENIQLTCWRQSIEKRYFERYFTALCLNREFEKVTKIFV